MFFDSARVVTNPAASLADGAIRGWDHHNAFYFTMIQGLAKHYKFDVQKPWNELPEKIRKIVLYGNEGEKIQFKYENKKKGNKWAWQHAFEGIIPNMKRRYSESDSAMVREELGKYQSTQPCADVQRRAAERGRSQRVRAGSRAARDRVVERRRGARVLRRAELEGLARRDRREDRQRDPQPPASFSPTWDSDYLSLDRSADTLSGGEAQRIRLASQIGSGLVGVMYILDEPSIGLHQRDNQRLLDTLLNLRDLGNTVLVVEHDREAILAADHVVDLGPGAGVHGGQVVASGTPAEIMANAASLTGQYLSGRREIPLPATRREFDPQLLLEIQGARGNNLKGVDVAVSGRAHDLRHRRVGLRQEHARERHALSAHGAAHQQERRGARAVRDA